jgi:hypothetical protein
MKTRVIIYGLALALTNSLAGNLKAQDIYIVNGPGGTVGQYGLDGATINAALISGLRYSIDNAISGNDLFVADYNTGIIGE